MATKKINQPQHRGGGILRNKVTEEICTRSGTKCLECTSKVAVGAKQVVVKNAKGETRAIFCCRNCQQEYEHKQLEELGFYD